MSFDLIQSYEHHFNLYFQSSNAFYAIIFNIYYTSDVLYTNNNPTLNNYSNKIASYTPLRMPA